MSDTDDLRGEIYTGSSVATYQCTDVIGKSINAATGEERLVTVQSLQERQVRALEDIAKNLAIIAAKRG